jgi:hypothetical protein
VVSDQRRCCSWNYQGESIASASPARVAVGRLKQMACRRRASQTERSARPCAANVDLTGLWETGTTETPRGSSYHSLRRPRRVARCFLRWHSLLMMGQTSPCGGCFTLGKCNSSRPGNSTVDGILGADLLPTTTVADSNEQSLRLGDKHRLLHQGPRRHYKCNEMKVHAGVRARAPGV